jgi:hypothetical protein
MNKSNTQPQTEGVITSPPATCSAALTYEQYRACLEETDRRMKATNGHEYLHILKTRCMHCGASPKVKTRCRGWFETFMNILGIVLQQKGIISDGPIKPPNVQSSGTRDQPA